MKLLDQDRGLFSADLWPRIPAVLAALLAAERAVSTVIEDLATGKICFCGVAAFVRPATLAPILSQDLPLRQSLLQQAASGKPVFLSRKQVAAANARRDLSLVHLFGCPDSKDYTQPRTFEIIRLAFEAFAFHHAGYQLQEILQEAIVPEAIAFVSTTGMPEVRRLPALSGAPAHLYRFTHADALQSPGNPMTQLMRFPKPRLGFTIAEQRLLELALMDLSDRDAAAVLHLTEDAIKKRWRGIYLRVRPAGIVPPAASGADQRRALLAYVRQHVEELRPFRA